jgi:CheY-like chemotaxis protein
MLMELHSGQISASSAGLGRGSTFRVELPLLRAERAIEITPLTNGGAPTENAVAAKAPLRMLLVEDHDPTRFALERLLVRRGHQVLAVGGIADARAAVKKQRFDLLVSDIGLPDGSGHDLMRELRDNFAMPGIALTGYGTEADIVLAKEAGFLAHLTKPVRVPLLDEALGLVTAAIDARKTGVDLRGSAASAVPALLQHFQ